ncbi:hypothetical protein EIP91_002075 [Steccherinum ochraceum]|uniref:BHLH domain-containing protein n=1 Tax=Steccherinum ochraceum TaxID=92696 RepID=A0A4R0RXF4_9APHY|nr:hypothetical protein EIP91_002075 [Steccherinum ochraceum]
MNAAPGAHDHHQKDFLNSFFPPDQAHSEHDQHARNPDMYHNQMNPGSSQQHSSMMNLQHQQHNMQNPPVAMDVLELMAMQDRAGQSSSGGQGSQATTPQMLLEQQVRLNQLQQLQQLQNQIFQQQIELLSGNSNFPPGVPGSVDRSRDQQQYGLPTPASSTELHAQHSNDFVSPMMLQSSHGSMSNLPPQQQQSVPPNFIPHHMIPPTPHSAPANIVFQQTQSPHYTQELDFAEISPLTSPWLGAYNHNVPPDANGMPSGQRPMAPSSSPSGRKRRPSPGSGEEELSNTRSSARKRAQPGPPNRMTPSMPPLLNSKKSNLRGTRSANSTPVFPATTGPGSRISPGSRNSVGGGEVPGDTPSPVDLSMPPPAPPSTTSSNSPLQFVEGHSTSPPLEMGNQSHNPSMSNPMSLHTPQQQQHQPSQQHPSQQLMPPDHLMPVTPASIMNLGRLGTNSALAPPPLASPSLGPEKTAKAKPAGRSRASTVSMQSNPTKSTANSLPLVSPSLKPIRPAGNATSGASTPTTPIAQPTLAGRKTSHKAAEQKRRDSLKTSFDELRLLLPPIPLPSDEGYPDEPVLPGAMPPRGPPKGNADGPNRGVSKLQLLRCGNDYIRVLKARVDRRDSEIDLLRNEVARLRLASGDSGVEGAEPIDLEKDMDAVETAVGGIFAKGSVRFGAIPEGDEDEDGD